MTNAILIPVDTGVTTPAFVLLRPSFLIASSAVLFATCCIKDAPAALGCGAVSLPLLPIPWLKSAAKLAT